MAGLTVAERAVADRLWAALSEAAEAGLVSRVVCQTHDGVPLSEEEWAEIDEGFDPCVPVVRLW